MGCHSIRVGDSRQFAVGSWQLLYNCLVGFRIVIPNIAASLGPKVGGMTIRKCIAVLPTDNRPLPTTP